MPVFFFAAILHRLELMWLEAGVIMNQTIKSLFERKSVRAYAARTLSDAERNLIIDAAIQAPTAGNQVLYTILDITDQALRDSLAVVCDNQPFIATAPLVLVYLADCRKWLDCYRFAGASPREPGPGDLLLACCDALIAAQNSVVAAESLGVGSCYIGDIMENREQLVQLLGLDRYTLPVTMVVYGYPTEQQRQRSKPARFDRRFIVRENRYSPLAEAEARTMFEERQKDPAFDYDSYIKAFCARKYMSAFSKEMNRSVAAYLDCFRYLP